MERKLYIYKATNLINNKVYIGQSVEPMKRIKAHINVRSKNGYLLNYAIKKYGVENFLFEVIKSEIPIEQINEAEIQCIKEHNCKVPLGYNLTDGGEGLKGYVCSDETRKKLSIAAKNRPSISEETRKKKSTALLGIPRSEEIKKKIRLTKQSFSKEIKAEIKMKQSLAALCREHTEETREKLRLANIGKKQSEEVRKKMSESGKNAWKERKLRGNTK